MAQHKDQLKQFGALTGVPLSQLEWLEQHSKVFNYFDGDFITVEGTDIDGPHFIVEGHVILFMKQGNENREIVTLGEGEIFGYLPYSRSTHASYFVQAIGPVRIVSFNTKEIRIMIRDHFELSQALVHMMNNRVRDFTALQQQNDKMAALGKLAAGLAHELNNPAAALVSDALSLRLHLDFETKALKELTALGMEPSQARDVNKELLRIMASKYNAGLSLKERSRKEEEVAGWLDKHEVTNSEDLSEIFVDFNISPENLQLLERFIPEQIRSSVFDWMHHIFITEKMIRDIQVSSSRISELIKSVKIYTHMDRGAEKSASDIHSGISNTLSILGHKLRAGNIELDEIYDRVLPPVMAYTGELNQVWTNLIDNALDSMQVNKKGKLTISTQKDREFVKIMITDNGPGIPETIRSNIFDPFFTTKDVGKGTGMGLETVQRIVLKHKGTVKVQSLPGETTFTVCLPVDYSAANKK
ncbi:sensor histidine kinase [Dyadobacter subterraneus]|uniref:histidine kinase n=1 Tax=Dyadobacter subterraneus TaxID=2773304 RepID=A0ABR9W911_9BACT|nr:ATP-binding protein [Dyadobacter subterraneus]MBE9461927.1 GHKL domain-containing protein [Dyadobacter subterraneus]